MNSLRKILSCTEKEISMEYNRMSLFDFIRICTQYTVDPYIALENYNCVEALRANNCELLEKILQEEF